jgi:hypothetical protein
MRPVSHAAFLLLLTAFTASAQCYTFSGPGVKLSINIVIINQTFGPVVTQAGAATTYAFSGLNTFTLGGVTQTSADVLDGAANIQYLAGIPNVPGDTGVTSFVISVPNSDTSTKGNHFWTADLAGVGNLIPSYTLPQSLPGILAWQGVSNTNQISVTHGGAPINYPITAIGTCGSNTGIDGKLLGDTSNDPGDCHCNDPIDLRSGNLFQQFLDYRTSGPNPLSLIRYYNSMSSSSTLAGTLGPGWRTNYDRYLRLSPNSVAAERADGKEYTFTLNNGNWTMDTDADVDLHRSRRYGRNVCGPGRNKSAASKHPSSQRLHADARVRREQCSPHGDGFLSTPAHLLLHGRIPQQRGDARRPHHQLRNHREPEGGKLLRNAAVRAAVCV